jgi:HD domain-containing protein
VPETELERRLSADPTLRRGWAWGEPRSGHPEGRVGAHVADLLRTIDAWNEAGPRRSELRFLALVHDSLKFQVEDAVPKSGANDHAVRARRLAERYTDDERLLGIIEEHDRPYRMWRRLRRSGRLDEDAFERMLEHVKDPALFLRFVELDGSTEGKNPEPVVWFRDELRRRGVADG